MKKIVAFKVSLILTAVGLIGAGCATDYNQQAKTTNERLRTGDIQGAATNAQAAASKQKSATGRDAVLLQLEAGAALRVAGQYKDSIAAFDTADEGISVFEGKTKGNGAAQTTVAVLSNPAMLPYEGYAYDKIMLDTYRAADYLQLGDFDNARVEFNKALERQEEAVAINAARIEKAQASAKTNHQSVDVEKIQKDAKFSAQWDKYYMDLDKMKFYSNYQNPFTEYLSGLFFMCQPTGGSDLQRARKSFEFVLGMEGENQFIDDDMNTVQQVISGQTIAPTTYVVFETGQAPTRQTIRIDVPLFIAETQVPYAGMAFPKLVFNKNYALSLSVWTGDTNVTTVRLCSMDSVIAQEFKNDMPRVITLTVASAAVKAGISYGISQGTKNNVLFQIPWIIYQMLQNKADLRSWNTLPKEIQFCRFAPPPGRKIEIAINGSGDKIPVTIDDGTVNLIWVRSISATSPLQISQFKLK